MIEVDCLQNTPPLLLSASIRPPLVAALSKLSVRDLARCEQVSRGAMALIKEVYAFKIKDINRTRANGLSDKEWVRRDAKWMPTYQFAPVALTDWLREHYPLDDCDCLYLETTKGQLWRLHAEIRGDVSNPEGIYVAAEACEDFVLYSITSGGYYEERRAHLHPPVSGLIGSGSGAISTDHLGRVGVVITGANVIKQPFNPQFSRDLEAEYKFQRECAETFFIQNSEEEYHLKLEIIEEVVEK